MKYGLPTLTPETMDTHRFRGEGGERNTIILNTNHYNFFDSAGRLLARYPLLVALGAGALATLGLPPWYFFPATILSLAFLYHGLCHAKTARRAAWLAYAWHVGYFVCGLYWIGAALLIDAAQFAWALPFAVLGLPMVLALYGALLGAAFFRTRQKFLRSPIIAGIGFAVLWAAVEFARGHLFTGFPWNSVGYAWLFSDASAQLGVSGLWALGAWVVLLAVAVVWWQTGQRRAAAMIAILAIITIACGAWRVPTGPMPVVDGVRLRLVQPNIEQRLKWDRAALRDNMQRLMTLSQSPSQHAPTHIIWPETAVPYDALNDVTTRAALARIAPGNGLLILGAPLVERDDTGAVTRLTNSIVALNARGEKLAAYDKFHLVPFGEYNPLPDMLGLKKITPGSIDFTPGPGPQTWHLPHTPALSPLVCYEIIFPGRVIDKTDRPAWILNLTNDGWYGRTVGPHQHLAQARLRAIETGLPVVRVANTGISAVIDPYGRMVVELPLGEKGILDTELPQALPKMTQGFGQE